MEFWCGRREGWGERGERSGSADAAIGGGSERIATADGTNDRSRWGAFAIWSVADWRRARAHHHLLELLHVEAGHVVLFALRSRARGDERIDRGMGSVSGSVRSRSSRMAWSA
jgi:hypothetical protein